MSDKYIAFTFDDGPNTTVTPLVADLFEQFGGHATFFVVGNNIDEASANVMKRAFDSGHEIESHSLTHSVMSEQTVKEICFEMTETDKRIFDVIGYETKFFRPPYIAYNDILFDTVHKAFICGRGVDDWDKSVTVEQRIKGLLEKAEDGGIILLHDQHDNYATVEALKIVLPKLAEQGYSFVTLSRLFEIKGIVPDTTRHIIYSNVTQTGDTYE